MAGRKKIRQRKTKESKRSLNDKNRRGRRGNGRHHGGGQNGPRQDAQDRPQGLPSREELQQYLLDHPEPQNKREIARAFGITGQDRTALRRMLREMSEDGMVEKDQTRSFRPPGALPERALIEITGLDGDGELRAKPAEWQGRGPAPIIYVLDARRNAAGLQPGHKVLASLKKTGRLEYEARILKTIELSETGKVIGVFRPYKGGGHVHPTDKKNRKEYYIPPEHVGEAKDGDLVVAETLQPSQKHPRAKNPARIAEKLGKRGDPRLISLISIHSHGIPTEFSKDALAEAARMKEPELSEGRVDLRQVPLVTIDGADARDFDDAVFAEPDPQNPGGWHLIVAIADVSYYVRPGSALDKTALERGNSTYFADRVVPMLPERLSNDLCSLRPNVNRACLAMHLWIDKDANLTRYRIERALMRSAARLTYEQVETAHIGHGDETTAPLKERVIAPLYKVYSLLKHARERRGALEIDLPERKAIIDASGVITDIVPRKRLASHQLIEEFMILANVAAALALEQKNAPCVYRVHDRPAFDRLETTREFLKEAGYSLPRGDHLKPKDINHILKISAEREDKELIHTVLLRTQAQAVYSPDNLGHFGLALEKYAHFTSPIRRYADLLVHRSLVKAWSLGDGALTPDEAADLRGISEHISGTERRSMLAERDVMDRFTAQYLSVSLGKTFKGRIGSVTRFGLFVTLDESGADGIVPMSTLPRDYYVHDEKRHRLIGKNTGRAYRLADPVVVRLVEADALRGSTVFEIMEGGSEGVFDLPPHDGGGGFRGDRRRHKGGGKQHKNRDKNRGRRRR
jgi:ribonuclease R